ncbi:MAG: acylglycerol kinase family protein [Eggerthellaceae bacterium]
MPMHLGKTLLIANPVSQNGKGARAAARAEELLRRSLGDGLHAVLTESEGHAVELAARAGGFDAVVVLGGDGIVHEAANGLMRLPGPDRPALGLIPVGSGNDARTLGMAGDVERACAQLLSAQAHPADLGVVSGCLRRVALFGPMRPSPSTRWSGASAGPQARSSMRRQA